MLEETAGVAGSFSQFWIETREQKREKKSPASRTLNESQNNTEPSLRGQNKGLRLTRVADTAQYPELAVPCASVG